jgi:hypothetical protein
MPPASYGELQIWRTFLEHPTAAWTAQQLVDAFPEESAPAYLLRDVTKSTASGSGTA